MDRADDSLEGINWFSEAACVPSLVFIGFEF
jgi:hypothetical protein